MDAAALEHRRRRPRALSLSSPTLRLAIAAADPATSPLLPLTPCLAVATADPAASPLPPLTPPSLALTAASACRRCWFPPQVAEGADEERVEGEES